jgi:hypothetical protein
MDEILEKYFDGSDLDLMKRYFALQLSFQRYMVNKGKLEDCFDAIADFMMHYPNNKTFYELGNILLPLMANAFDAFRTAQKRLMANGYTDDSEAASTYITHIRQFHEVAAYLLAIRGKDNGQIRVELMNRVTI